MFGVLRIVFLFFISYFLLVLLDLFQVQWVHHHEHGVDWFAHVMCKEERVRKTGLILVEGMEKGIRRPKITLI